MSNSTDESDAKWYVAQDDDGLDPPINNEGRLKGKMSKRPWTPEEDMILIEYVKNYGSERWDNVKKHYELDRTGKSCRFRYVNHLDPRLKKGPLTLDEQQLIFRLHAIFGNQWALIAKQLPGRRDNQIKNFWNTVTKKHKRTSLPPDPPAVHAQLYIENPIQSIGDFNNEIQRKQIWAVDARGGNPGSFFGRAPLEGSCNIVPSQDLGSQVGDFSHSFFSSTRSQAHQIFPPGSLYDVSGRSTQPFVFNHQYGTNMINQYGTNMITKNIVSTGGGGGCPTNNNYSTSRTSLWTQEAELPSFQCSEIKYQYHDQYHGANSSVTSHLETDHSNLYFPEEAVPIQSDSHSIENTFEGLFEEAYNGSEYALPKEFDFSDLNSIFECSSILNEPTPQSTGVSSDELPSSKNIQGMEIVLPDMQKETSDAPE